MAECTNRRIGALLLAYELQALPEKDADLVAEHLLQCDHCFREFAGFQKEATLLAKDPDIKALVAGASPHTAEPQSLLTGTWKRLWPKVPFMFRPAVAYLLLLLMILPVYYGLKTPPRPHVQEVSQTVELILTRQTMVKTFKKSLGEIGLLTLECSWVEPGESYRVVIESADGAVIYDNSAFNSFDWSKMAALHLYLADLEPGKYRLLITDPRADSSSRRQQYYFGIEE